MRASLLLLLPFVAFGSIAHAGVVINELMPNPLGGDGDGEWLELYNDGASEVSLDGWELQAGTSSFGTRHTFGPSDAIAAGGYLVIGESLVTAADIAVADINMGNAGASSDAIRIVDDNGTVIDTVVYGIDNTDDWVDDTGGLASSMAPKPGDGEALARSPNGVDTDASGDDFVGHTGTMGLVNPDPPDPIVCVTGTGTIVINEFAPGPSGATGLEFFELYNTGADQLLDGWVVVSRTNQEAAASDRWVFPADTSISAGGFYVVGDSNIASRDDGPEAGSTLAMPNGTGADALQLIDCDGNIVDTVIYGSDNSEDLLIDDTDAVATSVAAKPGASQSLARIADGVDSEISGADFQLIEPPTPGAANPLPPVCTAGLRGVKINEALTDPEGTDGEAATEFVELFNGDGSEASIEGWYIVLAGKEDDTSPDLILPIGTTVPAGGWFVMGNANTQNLDLTTEWSIGNGSGVDAIRLYDCEGTLMDSLVYGGENTDLITDDTGAVADAVAKPGSDQSIARTDDGSDNNARDDWFIDRSPTPGETNFQEPPDVIDPDDTDSGGCGGDASAPGADAPTGDGCNTAPARGTGLLFLVMLCLARRREA